ncbi:hypothetical protein J1N35_004923 [Gossypium stocksii]|uniref:RNase H type-1 domain-containing protein n=1 Tax=Gossypium stocksii TaxID=47602 RepID=A0A9D3WEJ6_9ROSI|nr:hypothetical protein J1N35_004923 [Gossypium stocksii]
MCGCLWFLISSNKASEVVKVSSCWARQYESNLGGQNYNNQSSNSTNNSEDTWVYLSTDGALTRDSRYATTGGVARDHNGNWLVGFTRFLDGYRRIFITTDKLEVAQNLIDVDLEDSRTTMLRRTQRIMQSEGEWKIKHIPRSQNLVADRLAKLSLSWKSSL